MRGIRHGLSKGGWRGDGHRVRKPHEAAAVSGVATPNEGALAADALIFT
jgi:hypothetical protein